MSMNDRLSDMITRIRNGQRARLAYVTMPGTKLLSAVADVLVAEGYVESHETTDLGGGKRVLSIKLKYYEGAPVISEIVRISKPGRRQYHPIATLPKFRNGLGVQILSTPKGVLSDFEARRQNVGGEVLCRLF